jgi:hypothetical protein
METNDENQHGCNVRRSDPRGLASVSSRRSGGMWTGEAQCWNNDVDAGHIVTRKTYATHEEALAGILNEVKISVTMYEN